MRWTEHAPKYHGLTHVQKKIKHGQKKNIYGGQKEIDISEYYGSIHRQKKIESVGNDKYTDGYELKAEDFVMTEIKGNTVLL